ncbi:MAG: molybdenum ABC transporter ATP-binding protein [Paracoccaceae bacterium]
MSLSVQITHRFGGFTIDTGFETGPGVTALFGRSGAGKTTIVNAVAGLLRPDKGQIIIDGDLVFDHRTGRHLPPHKRALGYVFQDARLFPHLTVLQNLRYGGRFAKRPATISEDGVIALLGLAPLLERHPAALSGGEKQRAALGRALLSRPRMLLMDEPLAALDAPRKQHILPYLERLKAEAGLPILYVSHAVDEIARLADQMILLKDGRVAASGPVFDVMADPAAIPLLGVREAGAVLRATVTDHASDGLSRLQVGAGPLELPGVKAPIGTTLRLRVLAQDVILSLDPPQGLSAVNSLPVTITGIHPGDGPGAAITLDASGERLLARITARTVKTMGLRTGLQCHAIIKAMAVAPGAIGAGPDAL